MEPESTDQLQSPALSLNDKDLLQELFTRLGKSVSALADPYSNDGSYASAIHQLPVGLRSMAATHHLDVSLTLDDIGWHFLNFGEPNFVRETESGLRELGLDDMADWFAEAFAIVKPLRPEIESCGDYYACLKKHGRMGRIAELTQMARDKGAACSKEVSGSPIYAAWISYARRHPENVFRN